MKRALLLMFLKQIVAWPFVQLAALVRRLK